MLVTKLAALAAILTASPAYSQSASEDGIRAFQEGRYSAAIKSLQRATDARSELFYGLSLAGAARCQEALPLLTRTVADPKLQLIAGLATAKCYSAQNENIKAIKKLDSLGKQFPDDPDVLYLTAKVHIKAFNDDSLALFRKAPSSYRVHELSAEIFEINGRYAEAADEYQKALQLNATAPDLHYRFGRAILLRSHDPEALSEAAKQFREELKGSPEDSASYYQLSQIALAQSNTTAARDALQKALVITPEFVQALVALAKLDLKEKKIAEAIAFLSHAITAQPDNESAHYALMTAYRDSGDLERAKAEKATLDRLNRPPEGEFSNFLNKLSQKPATK